MTVTLVQPASGSQLSVVQVLPSSQLGAGPLMQNPLTQVSVVVQAFASSHEFPSGTAVFTQPVATLQVSTVHWFPSSQSGGAPPVQIPDWQTSKRVHAF
jgi:hypothetical protein